MSNVLIVIDVCFNCLIPVLTSIFYGWASLFSLLLDSGVNQELCRTNELQWNNDEEINTDCISICTCTEQKARLTFIYTVASSVNLCSQLPWGVVLDYLGPRVCNLWSTTLVTIGFVLMSLSSRNTIDAYLPAMCLIGGAGPGVQISLFHLSELFPTKYKSTVLSVVTGAFQLGFIIFMLFQMVHAQLHISISNLFLVYCIPLVLLVLLGGVFWPDYPCIPPDDDDPLCFTNRRPSFHSMQWNEDSHGKHRAENESLIHNYFPQRSAPPLMPRREGEAIDEFQPIHRSLNEGIFDYGSIHSRTPPVESLHDHHLHRSLFALRRSQSDPNLRGAAATKGFCHQMIAASYLMCLLWMCICLFWANFYIGTVVEQINIKSHHELQRTHSYTNLFTCLLPSGLIGIGAFGWITSNCGFSFSIALTSLFATGYAASALWLTLEWQALTFILYSFFRSFLFSVMFAYLAHEFGYRNFGLLSGIILAVGGTVGLLQIPLMKATASAEAVANDSSDESAFDRINQLQSYTLLLTFYFPAYVFYRQRSRLNRVELQIEEHTKQLQLNQAFKPAAEFRHWQ